MPDHQAIIIFGASGDLTGRKLVPALYNLCRKERLSEPFHVLGMARSDGDDVSFRQKMKESVRQFAGQDVWNEPAWQAFESHLGYLQGDPGQVEDLRRLEQRLAALEGTGAAARNRLYYMAVPPQVYAGILIGLAKASVTNENGGWRRVVIEKPFGSDLSSAVDLNRTVHQVLAEDQIYRIDHYLGKETVQNVLAFRFANSIFEPIWNRNYIDHVQITVAEAVGIEHRGRFYDSVGVLRDMFQNHLIQLLSMTAMEPPVSFNAEPMRNERVKLLQAVRPIVAADAATETVRAQYQGYCQEPGVAADSQIATYAALRLYIDNWRWQGVPFFLRSGKALKSKSTEVLIQFKAVPHMMFPLPPGESILPNILVLCLQPDEGMHLRFEVKVPDTFDETRSVDMEFHYADAFGAGAIPDAYERLLLDALHGDASLFTRADGIELAWKLIDPILEGWAGPSAPPLASYAPGTWGPAEADRLIGSEGRTWSMGCDDRHREAVPPG
jgi:glucose-6-phosphate 1-dehydrogenase